MNPYAGYNAGGPNFSPRAPVSPDYRADPRPGGGGGTGSEDAGLVGEAGSVAARTARLTVSGRARRAPMKAQRRSEDLNISKGTPESVLDVPRSRTEETAGDNQTVTGPGVGVSTTERWSGW